MTNIIRDLFARLQLEKSSIADRGCKATTGGECLWCKAKRPRPRRGGEGSAAEESRMSQADILIGYSKQDIASFVEQWHLSTG
jgi:hypothetical protein